MIIAKHLTKSFGRVKALDDFSATLSLGRTVFLTGPNGSGKTTFLKCILGLVRPDQGSLTLDDQDLLHQPQLRQRIGYMPQIGRYPDHLKVGQIIDMMRAIRADSHDRTDEDLITAFEIGKFAHKPARTLSGGMRQKLSACLALLFDPEVLILDEPTASLDPVSAEILKEKVRSLQSPQKLILLTSHVLSDLDHITTDLMYLVDGRIEVHSPVQDLLDTYGETQLSKAVLRIMRESGNSTHTLS